MLLVELNTQRYYFENTKSIISRIQKLIDDQKS